MNIFTLFGTIFVDNAEANEKISKTGKEADSLSSKIGKGLKTVAGIGVAVASIVAVGSAALYGMATKAAEATDRIDKMSQKIGISRTAFQEMDFACSQSGTSVDKLQAGLKTMTAAMDGVKNGNKTNIEQFERLGVAVLDANGNLRSQEDVMFDTLEALQGVENQTEKSKLATELFGKAGLELMPMLNGAAGSIDSMRQQAHDLGLVISDDAVDAGVKFTDTIDQFKRSLGAVTVNIGTQVMPAIQTFASWILEHMPEIQSVISQVFNVISAVVGAAVTIVQWLIDAFGKLYDENNQLGINLSEIWGKIQNMFNETLGNLVALIQSFIVMAIAFWEEWGDTILIYVKAVWEQMKIIFNTAFIVLNDIFAIFKNLFSGNWTELWNSLLKLVEDILIAIEQIITISLTALINIFASIGAKIKEKWVETWTAIKTATATAIEAVKTAINQKFEDIKNTITEFGTKVIDSLKDLPEQAKIKGKEFIDGFIKGVTDKVEEAKQKVIDFGNSIVDAVKSVFDSHSPSRKMEQEGKNFVYGFAGGVSKTANVSIDAVKELCNDVLMDFKVFSKKYQDENDYMTEKDRKAYDERAKVLKEYIADKKYYNDISIQEEHYIYEQLLVAAKGNATEVIALNKEIDRIKNEIQQQEIQNIKDYIEDKKYYNNLSLEDEYSLYEQMKYAAEGNAETIEEVDKELYRIKKEMREQETQHIKDSADEWVSIIQNAYDGLYERIEATGNSELQGLQSQLDAMDEEDKQDKYNDTKKTYEDKIIELKRQLSSTEDFEKYNETKKKLNEEEAKYESWLLEEQRKEKRRSIQDQMKDVKENIAKEKEERKKQMEDMIQAVRENEERQIELVSKGAEGQVAISAFKASAIKAIQSLLTEDLKENIELQNINFEKVQDDAIAILQDKSKLYQDESQKIGNEIVYAIESGMENENSINRNCDSLWNTVKETSIKGWNGICKWIDKNANEPVNIIMEQEDAYLNAGQSVISAFWDGMKYIWTNLSEWVEEKTDEIQKQLTIWRESQAEMSGGSIDGSHKDGLSYVPFDGYKAVLHEGERVLTKEENNGYRNGNKGSTTISVTQHIYSPSTSEREQQRRAEREFKKLGLMR